MSQLHILHISKWYPNRTDDLEGVFVRRHIESTLPQVHATVITGKVEESLQKFYEIEYNHEYGINTYRFYYRKHFTRIEAIDKVVKMAIFALLTWRIAVNHFKKSPDNKPNLIQAHVLVRTGMIAYLLGKWYSVPYILTEHNTLFSRPLGTFKAGCRKRICAQVVKRAAAVVTVSNDLEQGMKRNGMLNEHYLRIFNNVDTQLFYPDTFKTALASPIRFLQVAELNDHQKNTTGLLRLLAELRKKHQNFRFEIVGYGQDQAKVQQQIADLNMHEYVHFIGKLTGEALAERYRQADMLLLYSNAENLPCVIPEAFVSGTPVLSTNVGGIAEIINDSNGRVIPMGNSKQYLAVLENMCAGKLTFNRSAIADDANHLFSNEAIGKQFCALYQAIARC